ncbi:MAG: sugar O-acetyltransferase [Actinobacteria bacterium]|nr:sugar O-acetyltransferase [Actinomycetota bacterium]
MKPVDPNDQRTMQERMDAGDWYKAGPEQWQAIARASRLTTEYNNLLPVDSDAALALLPEIFGTVGSGVWLREPIKVDFGKNIHWGDHCFANYGLIALDVAPIRIGAGTMLGTNVQLMTPIHPLNPELRAEGWEAGLPITIGSNVWVGSGAIILAGVTIGDGAVVGAGAVVSRDVAARTVVAGNPAKLVRELPVEG